MKYLAITLLIFNLTTLITSTTLGCSPIAKCNADHRKKDTCITLNKNSTEDLKSYDISRCHDGYTCKETNLTALTDSSDVPCVNIKTKKVYLDKEECFGDNTCYSRNCGFDHYCIGRAVGEDCLSNNECANGLFCFNSKCENLREIGGRCQSDYDCVVGAGCTLKGYCFRYYSLKSGDRTQASHFCETGYSHMHQGQLKCAETKLTQNDCDEFDQCSYDVIMAGVTIENIQQNCKCSLAHSDKKFCILDTHNATWVLGVSILRGIDHGHTSRRFTPTLMFGHRAVKEALYYPLFKDVDTCVIDLYLASSYFGVSLIALVLLFIF